MEDTGMTLEFPFFELSPAAKAFSTVPNREELLEKCPKDVDPRFIELARKIQCGEVSFDLPIRAASQKEADQKLEYLTTLAEDYNFKAEDKWRVMGWLLSMMVDVEDIKP
ncbi:MAG: hypothetical protein HGB08_04295 [Candidatus Moranbacteria bacterium]|nr:hypothetical protein [Candidatus Moranbacteria bacterium]